MKVVFGPGRDVVGKNMTLVWTQSTKPEGSNCVFYAQIEYHTRERPDQLFGEFLFDGSSEFPPKPGELRYGSITAYSMRGYGPSYERGSIFEVSQADLNRFNRTIPIEWKPASSGTAPGSK